MVESMGPLGPTGSYLIQLQQDPTRSNRSIECIHTVTFSYTINQDFCMQQDLAILIDPLNLLRMASLAILIQSTGFLDPAGSYRSSQILQDPTDHFYLPK